MLTQLSSVFICVKLQNSPAPIFSDFIFLPTFPYASGRVASKEYLQNPLYMCGLEKM